MLCLYLLLDEYPVMVYINKKRYTNMKNISSYFYKQQPLGFGKKYKYFKMDESGQLVLETVSKGDVSSLEKNNWRYVGLEGKAPIFEEEVVVSEEILESHKLSQTQLNNLIKTN